MSSDDFTAPSSAFAGFRNRLRNTLTGGGTTAAAETSPGSREGAGESQPSFAADDLSGGGSWLSVRPGIYAAASASSPARRGSRDHSRTHGSAHPTAVHFSGLSTTGPNTAGNIDPPSGAILPSGSREGSMGSSSETRFGRTIRNVGAALAAAARDDYLLEDATESRGHLPTDLMATTPLRSGQGRSTMAGSPSRSLAFGSLNLQGDPMSPTLRLKREMDALSATKDHNHVRIPIEEVKPSTEQGDGKYPLVLIRKNHTECLGKIGNNGRVCLELISECTIAKHKPREPYYARKGSALGLAVNEDSYYVNVSVPGGKLMGLVQPWIPAEFFNNHPLGPAHRDSLHTVQEWSSLFQHMRQNPAPERSSDTSANNQQVVEGGDQFFEAMTSAPYTPYPKRLKTAPSSPPDLAGSAELKSLWLKTSEFLSEHADRINALQASLATQSYYMGVPEQGQFHPTVWKGLDSLDHRLADVENERLGGVERAAKVQGEEIKDLLARISSAQAASDTARIEASRARELAEQHHMTGSLEARVRTMEKDLVEASEVMGDFVSAVEGLQHQLAVRTGNGIGGSSSSSATAIDQSAMNRIEQRLLKVEKKTGGSQAVMIKSRFLFSTMEDVKSWLAKHNLLHTNAYMHFYDLHLLLGRVCKRAMSKEDVGRDAERSARLKLSPVELQQLASAATGVPEVLAGSDTTSSLDHPFHAMKTYDQWDSQDGFNGTKPSIQEALDQKVTEILRGIQQTYGDKPDVEDVLTGMVDKANKAWLDFAREVDSIYTNYLIQTFGSRVHTKDEKAQVWKIVITFVDVYWEEVARARVEARTVSHTTEPEKANVLMMWSALQGIAKHEEFAQSRFREHPKVHPKLQIFLFKTKASRDEITTLSNAAKAATSSSAATDALVRKLVARVETLEQKHGRLVKDLEGKGGKQRGKKKAKKEGEEEKSDNE